MYRGENLDRGNPQLECPDDSVCYQCGEPLPEVTNGKSDREYFAFEGFCGAGCAAANLAKEKTHLFSKEFMLRIAASAKRGELSA